MEAKRELPESNQEIITFFSSFLRDILNLASDIKYHAFQIVGINSPPKKKVFVSNNVYSILEACNHSFEDLRRAETMLRGHIKGQISAFKFNESIRESRFSVQNGHYTTHNLYPQTLKNERRTFQEPMKPRQSRQSFKMVKKQGQKTSNRLSFPVSSEELGGEKQKTLKQSKSHGQLPDKFSPVPSLTSRLSSTNGDNKGSIELINKIRTELGIGRRQ